MRLYEEGLIYRGKRLVNWDPVLQTALSDLEVRREEEDGSLWHIALSARRRQRSRRGRHHAPRDHARRHRGGGASRTTSATSTSIGKQLDAAADRTAQIPIIADDYVDPTFGTGCVKITPAHDFNDYEVGPAPRPAADQHLHARREAQRQRAGAVPRPRPLRGAQARRRRSRSRRACIEKIEPHKLQGAARRPQRRGHRAVAHRPVVREDRAAGRARASRRSRTAASASCRRTGRRPTYDWMRNIQDWCISRQLWWGHRIPAWYDDAGNDLRRPRRSRSARASTRSAPTSTLHAGRRRARHLVLLGAVAVLHARLARHRRRSSQTFYPTSVLVTGYDIIFFWVARMIMMGLNFMGDVPFRDVYITGLVRDENGEKMSKTKGNVIDPLDLIDGIDARSAARQAHHRPDAAAPEAPKIEKATRKQFPERHRRLRHRRAALHLRRARRPRAATSRFDLGRVEGYRNFCNKLWNAARFVLMNVEGEARPRAGGTPRALDRRPLDRLALRRDARAGRQRSFAEYRFDLAAHGAVRVRLVRVLRLVPRAHQARAAGRRRHRGTEARHAPHAA